MEKGRRGVGVRLIDGVRVGVAGFVAAVVVCGGDHHPVATHRERRFQKPGRLVVRLSLVHRRPAAEEGHERGPGQHLVLGRLLYQQ